MQKTITCKRVCNKKPTIKKITYKLTHTEGGGFTFLKIEKDAYDMHEETSVGFPNRRFRLEKLSGKTLDTHIVQVGPDEFCTCRGYQQFQYCKHATVLTDICCEPAPAPAQNSEGAFYEDLAAREYRFETMLQTARS